MLACSSTAIRGASSAESEHIESEDFDGGLVVDMQVHRRIRICGQDPS